MCCKKREICTPEYTLIILLYCYSRQARVDSRAPDLILHPCKAAWLKARGAQNTTHGRQQA